MIRGTPTPRPPALGHLFGAALTCDACLRTWDEHQLEPTQCPRLDNDGECAQGHEMTRGNTHVRPDGRIRCRTCDREQAQARRDARKQSLPE